jgi:hypothetical protein
MRVGPHLAEKIATRPLDQSIIELDERYGERPDLDHHEALGTFYDATNGIGG